MPRQGWGELRDVSGPDNQGLLGLGSCDWCQPMFVVIFLGGGMKQLDAAGRIVAVQERPWSPAAAPAEPRKGTNGPNTAAVAPLGCPVLLLQPRFTHSKKTPPFVPHCKAFSFPCFSFCSDALARLERFIYCHH